VIAQVLAGVPNKFLTLTSRNPGNADPVLEAERLSHALSVFAKRIARYLHVKKIEYAAFFEATEKGWPHLHLLGRWRFIPQSWLLDQWRDIIGQGGVNISKPKRKHGTANYVSAYVGKGAHKFGTLKRYRFTQGYRLPQKENWKPVMDADETWCLINKSLNLWCDERLAEQWRLVIRTQHFALARPPP
jgi:hypothetical protein